MEMQVAHPAVKPQIQVGDQGYCGFAHRLVALLTASS